MQAYAEVEALTGLIEIDYENGRVEIPLNAHFQPNVAMSIDIMSRQNPMSQLGRVAYISLMTPFTAITGTILMKSWRTLSRII
ncbi:hypothetical protein [Suicoccus acidiformans]|uniref:hypothetical protein n=1 Tax=Suicoccus acidiformans TaxID=2036206 RepID=UPI0013C2D4BB|nr:hypothetical protein [Suicoccus acidiformans]